MENIRYIFETSITSNNKSNTKSGIGCVNYDLDQISSLLCIKILLAYLSLV